MRTSRLKECVLKQLQVGICWIVRARQIGARVDLFDHSRGHERRDRRLFNRNQVEMVTSDHVLVQIDVTGKVGDETVNAGKPSVKRVYDSLLEGDGGRAASVDTFVPQVLYERKRS